MGTCMVAVARVLLFCAVVLLILLVPDKASAAATISVNPSSGPVGQTVIVTGTGWTQDYIFGLDFGHLRMEPFPIRQGRTDATQKLGKVEWGSRHHEFILTFCAL